MIFYCPTCLSISGYTTISHSGYVKYCEKHLIELPTEQFNQYTRQNYYTYTPVQSPKPKKRIWRAR